MMDNMIEQMTLPTKTFDYNFRPHVKAIFQGISAKAGPAQEPCCDWVGDAGAGHYVKMVHNGIEYGDMQLICEAYSLMKQALGMSCDEMSNVSEKSIGFFFRRRGLSHFFLLTSLV